MNEQPRQIEALCCSLIKAATERARQLRMTARMAGHVAAAQAAADETEAWCSWAAEAASAAEAAIGNMPKNFLSESADAFLDSAKKDFDAAGAYLGDAIDEICDALERARPPATVGVSASPNISCSRTEIRGGSRA